MESPEAPKESEPNPIISWLVTGVVGVLAVVVFIVPGLLLWPFLITYSVYSFRKKGKSRLVSICLGILFVLIYFLFYTPDYLDQYF